MGINKMNIVLRTVPFILGENGFSTHVHKSFRNLSSLTLTNLEVSKKRNEIFDKEKQRQQALVTRVEKINVSYVGVPEECKLVMNKNISTPFNCAMHMHEVLTTRSVLALVNNKPWDMHRPLQEDCDLNFLHFKMKDTFEVNKAFWRSCSFILGMVIEKAFKEEFFVELHSWPKPNVRSGSFVYDADLKIENWEATEEELRTVSSMLYKLSREDMKFERLELPLSVAKQMFEDNRKLYLIKTSESDSDFEYANLAKSCSDESEVSDSGSESDDSLDDSNLDSRRVRFKSRALPDIAERSENGDTIVVYRLGDHIDISYGPMISNTNQLGRQTVAAVHRIETPDGLMYRFQGVALPNQLPLNSFAFKVLVDNARLLNTSGLPPASAKAEIENV